MSKKTYYNFNDLNEKYNEMVGEEVLNLPCYFKDLQKGAGETAPLTVKANFEPSPHLLALQSARRDMLALRSKHGARQNLGALIRQSLVELSGHQ